MKSWEIPALSKTFKNSISKAERVSQKRSVRINKEVKGEGVLNKGAITSLEL